MLVMHVIFQDIPISRGGCLPVLAPRLNLRTKAGQKPEVSCRRPVPKLSKATVSQNPGVEADAWVASLRSEWALDRR
jgi:hypothetical protein